MALIQMHASMCLLLENAYTTMPAVPSAALPCRRK